MLQGNQVHEPKLLTPTCLEPALCNKRSHHGEQPAHCNEQQQQLLLTATRDSLHSSKDGQEQVLTQCFKTYSCNFTNANPQINIKNVLLQYLLSPHSYLHPVAPLYYLQFSYKYKQFGEHKSNEYFQIQKLVNSEMNISSFTTLKREWRDFKSPWLFKSLTLYYYSRVFKESFHKKFF